MSQQSSFRQIVLDQWQFITFRSKPEDFDRYGWRHLLLALGITLLVGIARNWDLPEAPKFATFGLGSVIYVILFSFFLFVFAWPLAPVKRNYFKVLTVVAMTAAPGLIYGIPVEMFLPLETAQRVNLAFLLIVASWRVGLAFRFFRIGCMMDRWRSTTALLTPISILIIVLVLTDVAGAVMNAMGGVRDSTPSVTAFSEAALFALFLLAWPVGLFGILSYLTTRYSDYLYDGVIKKENDRSES